MVPGSTLMYGSNFWMVTLRPRSTRRRPNEAAAMPLPRELTTPPVTKMYLVELTNSPLSGAGLTRVPRTPGLRRYQRRGPRVRRTERRRWECRAAGVAAVRAAPTAPQAPGRGAPIVRAP